MEDNIIKPATFRINIDDTKKFKDFADSNNLNQAEAFASLLNILELNNAKSALGSRANSIEVFQTTVNNLVKFYINSLEENVTTEDRIREDLSRELRIKDDTISNLMDQLQELKTDNDTFINTTNTLESKIGDLTNSIAALKDEIIDKSNSLDIANRNNNNLQDQLSEYKEFKNENVTLKKQLEQVQEALNEKSTSVSTLINNIKQLEDKIKTDTDMISFYREQLDVNKEEKINLNNSLLEKEKSHKDELKELEKKSKLEIIELKESHKNSIAEKIEQLNSKCELELGKKDLEIEKLKNELERLNNKTVKTSKKIQDKE
jgi:hypothetical protein